MHVLTPAVLTILGDEIDRAGPEGRVTLADALAILARRERYLALDMGGRRYDVGVKYGTFTAQLALALSGQDREQVLSILLELLALRESDRRNA